MSRAVQQGVTGETKTEEGKNCPLGNHSMQLYRENADSSRERRSDQGTARGVAVAQVRGTSEGSGGQHCQCCRHQGWRMRPGP